jgi:hypothetical protein
VGRRDLRVACPTLPNASIQRPDTEELLARAKTGDERAGIEAIARQRERLKDMLTLRMDKRLKAKLDPSDVIQESMIVASQRLGEFFRQEKVSFYVWLRSLTFERLIDMQRAHLYGRMTITACEIMVRPEQARRFRKRTHEHRQSRSDRDFTAGWQLAVRPSAEHVARTSDGCPATRTPNEVWPAAWWRLLSND